MTTGILGIGSGVGAAALARPIGAGGITAGAASQGATADFGTVLSEMAAGTAENLKAAEGASLQGVRGEVATQDVVQAVMKAEQSLQVAIAVRDKVVAAYLELSRMQI